MKIEGSHQLNAPRERIYQCLIDPQVLQRCIPGCERLEKTGENTYAATIRAGVGSIKGVFNGNVRLERSEEHTSELQSPCNLVCRLLLEKKKLQCARSVCHDRECDRTRHVGRHDLRVMLNDCRTYTREPGEPACSRPHRLQ